MALFMILMFSLLSVAAIFSALFCKGNIYEGNGKNAIICLIICIALLITNVILINIFKAQTARFTPTPQATSKEKTHEPHPEF